MANLSVSSENQLNMNGSALMTEYLDSWDGKKLNGSIDILGDDDEAKKELLNWLLAKKDHVIRKYEVTKGYFETEDWKIIKEPFGEYPTHSLQYQIKTLAKDLKGILSGLRKDLQNFLLDTKKEATNDAIQSLVEVIERKLARKRKGDDLGNKAGPTKKSKNTTNTDQPAPTFGVVKNEAERVLSLRKDKARLNNEVKDLNTIKDTTYDEIEKLTAKETSINESIKTKEKALEELTTAFNKRQEEFDLKTESVKTLSTQENNIRSSVQAEKEVMELLKSEIKTLEEKHNIKNKSVEALTTQEAIINRSIKEREKEMEQLTSKFNKLEGEHKLKTKSVKALTAQEADINKSIQEKTDLVAELENTKGTIEQTHAINSDLQIQVSQLNSSIVAYEKEYDTLYTKYHDNKNFMRSIKKRMIKEDKKDTTTKNLRRPGTVPIKRVGTSHTRIEDPNPVKSKQQETVGSEDDLINLTDESIDDSLSLQINT